MERSKLLMPQAKEDELEVQELPDEVLVYDLKRHRAYCLNRTAALVWRHCDGQTTVAEMARLLDTELQIPATEEMVWMALDRLGRAHLLREPATSRGDAAGYSRREVMRKLALVGGLSVLLPLVSELIAPTWAEAVTCVTDCTGAPNGTPCGPPGCSNTCQGGICD